MQDVGLLARLSRDSDAVINSTLPDDRGSVNAIVGALSGSNTPFVHSSALLSLAILLGRAVGKGI